MGFLQYFPHFLLVNVRVILNGAKSELTTVTSRVPQSSVPGPALFILFINDIVDCALNSSIRLFADDTLIYHPIAGADDQNELQDNLVRMTSWADIKLMIFNAGKSNLISFEKQTSDSCVYKLDGKIMNRCETIKYLGSHYI